MTVKFKIGFTVSAETLFDLLSKFLPIEQLSVEEVLDKTPRFDLEAQVRKLGSDSLLPSKHKPQRKKIKRASPGPNLEKGINGIIMVALSDGPKRAIDIQPKIAAAGFSQNSASSRLEELRKYGVIERNSEGLWRKK
jgi:hypothetical protein